jgi:pilus assembly protein CpaC
LIVRRAATTVELRDGQSFAVAGLLQSVNSSTKRQVPWIGDIPIIGTLFRSASFERNETDLAIIVTARLVRPARPGETLRSPLDTTVPANDPEFFLIGKMEISRSKLASEAGLPPNAPVGHMIDLETPKASNVSKR